MYLRSVLITNGTRGIPLRELNKQYSVFAFSNIPYEELGFSSLADFIKSVPDVASLERDKDGQFVVIAIPTEADQHIFKLTTKQRKPKKRAKPAAKLRRPTFSKKALEKRPLIANRANVIARPLLSVGPFVTVPSQSTFNANRSFTTAASLSGACNARSGAANRFIPPRMMNKVVNQSSANRTVTQRGSSGRLQVHVNNSSNTTSSKNAEVSQPVIDRTVVERGIARQVEKQAQEIVSSSNRKVTLIPRQEKSLKKKISGEKPVSPDNEVFLRIKKLIDDKPKGIWFKRIGAEYKKLYNEELGSEILEKLKELPSVARCENYLGDNVIVYPSNLGKDDPPREASSNEMNGESIKSVELYTLRPQELPGMGSVLEVTVSHVDSPTHFFVQYKHNWKQIEALGTKLNIFFQSNTSEVLPTAKQGMFCYAQFTEDDVWYRARVTKSDAKGDMVEVIYVDYGNHESLPLSRLCMLRKDHAELPMMAVLCALEGVASSNGDKWNDASIARFKELCDVETLSLKVVRTEGHYLYVELKDPTGNDLRTVLQKEGHIKEESDSSSASLSTSTSASFTSSSLTGSSSTDSFSSITTTTSSSSSSSHEQASPVHASIYARTEKETVETEAKVASAPRPFLMNRLFSKEEEVQNIPERVQIPDEDYLDVFVCNVHSTHNICVNLSGENYSEKLTALEQSMLCHYEDSSSEEAIQITPGGIFAVYSKEIHAEGLWYRVKVLKLKGDEAQIEYVDYGETGPVPISTLKSIPQRFLELPFQAIALSLHGVPKTKNSEVILKLKRLTLNKDLVAEVKRKNEDSVSVELYDTSSDVTDININRILYLIPDEEMKPVLPKQGEQIEAFVTYATLEGHIFIQIPGGGTTRLNELMQDITEHYSQQSTKAAEFVSSPQKEKIYCAKCSVDGAWYRALITQVFPERQVEVYYVDYGNSETLPISSLREPSKAISHVNLLPFQALECRLEGTDKKALTEEQASSMIERDVLLVVLQISDLPTVRLFVPSEEDEQLLVNVSELIGMETETQLESNTCSTEQQSGGNEGAVSESLDEADSADGDSVASESSSETGKSRDESDHVTVPLLPFDMAAPWVDISILEVDNPGLFMFQCLEMLQEIEELENEMQEYYAKAARSPFRDARPGVLCAALYSEDNTWYRAVVKASLSPHQLCVFFADYGDFKIVPLTNLQTLPDEFKQLPLMAVRGCLQGVEPVGDTLAEWAEEAIERFKELTLGKKLVAKPKGSVSHNGHFTSGETKVSLELYDTSEGNEDLVIAKVLVSEGLAREINES